MEAERITVEEIRMRVEENRCMVQKAFSYVDQFLAGPMCGKCFPCSFGSYEAKIRLQRIRDGKGTESDIALLRRIVEEMKFGSLCKKGKDTASFLDAWISDEMLRHIEGACSEGECKTFIEYRISPNKCTNCGACAEVCIPKAIIGEKKKSYLSGYPPFQIRQKRCTKCGNCIEVCPEKAIIQRQHQSIKVSECQR